MPTHSTLAKVLKTRPRAAGSGQAAQFDEQPDVRHQLMAVPLNGFIPEPPSLEELQIVQRLFFLAGDDIPRAVVFCGVEDTDGAESVCARTAEVLSSLVSETVCLMDANLRAPTLHLRYEIEDGFQFGGELNGREGDPEERLRGPSLWVLPAGALKDARPGFSPELVRARLTTLRENFGFLLMTAPPLSTAAEGFLLGQMADGVVLTVMAHSTRRAHAQRVRRSLELYNVRVLGAVLNHRPSRSLRAAWNEE